MSKGKTVSTLAKGSFPRANVNHKKAPAQAGA
jgi:hypothetical protein